MASPEFPMTERIDQLHQLYCRLTGQNLSLRLTGSGCGMSFYTPGFPRPN